MATINAVDRDLSVALNKLRVHADYAHKTEEELRVLADELTEFDSVFCQFSHLLQPVERAIDGALSDHRAVFTHSQEEDMARDRAKYDIACVIYLPVKLFLSRLSQPIPYSAVAERIFNFFLEYGALHAGLTVGNVRIEWGQEGIVDAQPEDIYTPEDEFIGTLDPRQGHLGQIADEINRQFSLAHRERCIDDKIKLIIHTAEEKKAVLCRLVRVITRYNLEKTYDIFSCNCQHFVREALSALGIQETPRFNGELNAHLQRLKQGRVEVPEHFQNHATLDAYVEQQLQAEQGSLEQHDMEYLLLHYYRLHVTSMPKDATDRWQCGVPTCMYEHLADRVNHEALLSIQISTRTSERYVPFTPTIQELPSPPDIEAVAENAASRDRNTEEQRRDRDRQREEKRRQDEELRRQQIAEDELTAKRVRPVISKFNVCA